MHGLNADIAVVHDAAFQPKEVVTALAGSFRVRRAGLDEYLANGSLNARLHIFCTSLRSNEVFMRVKTAAAARDSEQLFVLPTHNSASISRLRDLGVTDYLIVPIDQAELRAKVKSALNRQVERSWAGLDATKQRALRSSLASFQKCFATVHRGEPLPMEEVHQSCRHICDSAKLGGLSSWIEALDNHHDYSFRHSMFVCGTLTYFASAIGIGAADLERLTVGGLLHDIGKSLVPLEILDKPGKLDESEWQIMRTHPEHTRQILLREHQLDPDAVIMAVHHHEKLDGTGYPDGLAGAEIKDCVRLTAISDVYSALIDKRSYKGAMSREDALDLMAKFKGHLDMDLLGAFRSFVLDAG